jgi:hypothetical protein
MYLGPRPLDFQYANTKTHQQLDPQSQKLRWTKIKLVLGDAKYITRLDRLSEINLNLAMLSNTRPGIH